MRSGTKSIQRKNVDDPRDAWQGAEHEEKARTPSAPVGAVRGNPGRGKGTLGRRRMDWKGSDCDVHGFRSSFRDWAAEKTKFPREVVEAGRKTDARDCEWDRRSIATRITARQFCAANRNPRSA